MATYPFSAEAHVALDLPPAFTAASAPEGVSAFAWACRESAWIGAGSLIVATRTNLVDFAVVLEPEEPLRTAQLAFFAGMIALAEAVGSIAPPEKPVSIGWPDTLLFDGARLGGGRLGWPNDLDEAAIPDWLVFSATLIASKAWAGDPGLTPDSTSLEEEGFGPADELPLLGNFARYLLRAFDLWQDERAGALTGAYQQHLLPRTHGDLTEMDEHGLPIGLVAALRAPAWLDDATESPRL